MPKLQFTQARLAKVPIPESGRVYYGDAKTTGLALCVSSSGVKTFELCRRMGGRPTRLKLGRYPEMTAEQARREAARLGGEIAQGRDPAETRRKARGETTVGQLFALYLDQHAKPHKKSWQEDERQFKRYLSRWKGRKLSQVRQADVAALHAKIGRESGIYAANRALALLSGLFNFAARTGFERPNPARGVKRFREESRDRFLRADELRGFFESLAAEPDEGWRDFFALCLLTGARRANVEAMRWQDVELGHSLWRIPGDESKNAEPLLVILPASAVDILSRRADGPAGESEYVFPSHGRAGHITEPKAAWRRILARAGLKNLRLHDLRRTLGSWQAATGASLPVIGKSLGHKSLTATQVYSRLDVEDVRTSVNTAAEAMLAAGGVASPRPRKKVKAALPAGETEKDD